MRKFRPITKDQKKLFYRLLGNNGLREVKEDLVLQHSDGRTTHVSDMTQSEFEGLVKVLQSSDPTRTMRRKLFAIAYSLGWIPPNGDEQDRKMNTAKLNAFFKAKGAVKKEIGKMNRGELAKSITQLEMIKEKGIIHDLKAILEQAGIENNISYKHEGI